MKKTLGMMVAAIVVVLSIVIFTSCTTKPYTAERATTARDSRFIAYDNGTVLDTKTNLMWAVRDNGKIINWADAKYYCENYRGGDYTDWRMPTQDELAELYDETKTYKSDCGDGRDVHLITELIRVRCGWVWASETRGDQAAYFLFYNGKRNWSSQSDISYNFRALPVRSGK
jgi:Protein of unknown function (DUF1566)